MVYSTRFEQISYTKVVELLEEAVKKVKFQKPVVVYNYPKDINSFYMKVNDDCKTVAATDVLVPKVGELIEGSQREEHYEVIQQRYDNCYA
ncbi:asparagine--tRNA ligase, cytoplasmic 1-like [Castanea sativa]|uniref:asparagine--tRNA ligase, cytoplasmic 1-like n=1 Tax=Castanea sativa TaxID=21020 RepID=UPI003F64DC21